MRQSKPMARMVAKEITDCHIASVEGCDFQTAKAWKKLLDIGGSRRSFSAALSNACSILPEYGWRASRRKSNSGAWEYRFEKVKEEPTVIPTPDGPEIQEAKPVEKKMTPEEFCRRECKIEYTPYEKCRVYPCCSYRDYFGLGSQPANQPSATTVTDTFELMSKQNEALTEENASLRAQPAERPACPEDFIHKGMVRRRLLDILMGDIESDQELLKYIRELED